VAPAAGCPIAAVVRRRRVSRRALAVGDAVRVRSLAGRLAGISAMVNRVFLPAKG
jgi:hypothetical protein